MQSDQSLGLKLARALILSIFGALLGFILLMVSINAVQVVPTPPGTSTTNTGILLPSVSSTISFTVAFETPKRVELPAGRIYFISTFSRSGDDYICTGSCSELDAPELGEHWFKLDSSAKMVVTTTRLIWERR